MSLASEDNEKISSNVFEISREKLLADVQRLRDTIFERDSLFGNLYSQGSFGTPHMFPSPSLFPYLLST